MVDLPSRTASGHYLEPVNCRGHTLVPLQGLWGMNSHFASRSQQAVTQNPTLPRTEHTVGSQQSSNLSGEGVPRVPQS